MNKGREHPYFDKTGEPIVEVSYCVFADVLGFSNLVQECKSTDASIDLCKRIHRINEEHRNALSPSREFPSTPWTSWHYSMFSDSLVLGMPLDSSTDGEPEFGSVLFALGRYQLGMVLEGLYIRGGLALNELHISPQLCFGKALVEAANLEQSARFPRVVVSDDVSRLVDKHLSYYSDPGRSPQATDLILAHDGRRFVNYLSNTHYDDIGPDLRLLVTHRDGILKNLLIHKDCEGICEKYRWLRDYHNYFIENLATWDAECAPSERQIQELLINPMGDHTFSFSRIAEPKDWATPLTKWRH